MIRSTNRKKEDFRKKKNSRFFPEKKTRPCRGNLGTACLVGKKKGLWDSKKGRGKRGLALSAPIRRKPAPVIAKERQKGLSVQRLVFFIYLWEGKKDIKRGMENWG